MEYAIVESGGKQYKAVVGNTIEVDRLPQEVGDQIELDQVLFINDGKKFRIGTPTLKGAKVRATVVAQVKAPKIVVFKYKPKNRYRVKSGHRQRYTRLMVDKILKGRAPSKKKATKSTETDAEVAEAKEAKAKE